VEVQQVVQVDDELDVIAGIVEGDCAAIARTRGEAIAVDVVERERIR
jgi:hypothetical protein